MGKERKHHIKNKWVRRTVKTLCVIILLIILLPFTLYIPWVQNIAKNAACNYISEKTGLEVTIDRLLIKFPLDISLDNVLVLDQNRDTMAHVGNFNAGVELLPLLSLNVKVGTTTLTDAKMHIVSKDSSSIINAKLQKAVVLGSDIDLTHHRIKLLHGDLSDGDIHFESFPYKVIEEPDTTPPSQWDITVGKLNLNRVKCTMASEPTIDNLTANVVAGQLVDAHINMDKHTIEAGFIRLDSLDCNYTTRNEKEIAAFNKEHPIPPKMFQSNDTATWTIKGDSLRINGSRIAYNVAGASPQKGFDSNNIVLDNFNLAIDNYYNRGSTVVLPVKNLTLNERCGLKVKRAHGTVSLTDGNITASNMHVKTAQSTINLNANINTKALDKPPMGTISINTDSEISPQELAMISPEAGAMLAQVPQNKPIKVKASISGNQQKVTIDHFNAVVPNYAHATVSGTITNPLDSKRRKGELDVDADFRNVDFINDIMRKSMAGNSINIPPVAMKGHISLDGDRYTADANMNLYNGKMVGKAYFNGYKEEYDIDATFNGFPVRSIMPNSPVGNITGRVKAKGHGFDFLNGTAQADADMKLASIEYNKHTFNNIDLQARLNKNRLNAALSSHGKHCDLDLACNATFNKSTYDYDINGSINDLDLYQLGFSESPMAGKGKINAKGVFNTNTLMGYSDIKVTDMQCRIDNESFMADELTASVLSESDNVSITLDNEDTHLRFLAACGLQEFIDKMSNSATKASQQLENRSLDINALQASLPKFNFGLKMGSDGIIPRYLARQDIEFRDFNCDIQNDSTLYLNGWIKQMSIGTTSIDTITFNANEMNRYLAFKAHMGNRPGTLDDFAQVDINGGAVGSTVDMLVHQQNIKGKTGYRLGVNATLVDSMINMKLFPENPVIGYRQWELNDDNFLHYYYKNNMVDANLKLNSGSSLVAIRTEDAGSPNKRNILLNIKDLKIEEWLSLTPNESPPMSGTLGADMKLAFDGHNLDGGGTVGIKNFIYNGHREGDISLNTQLAVDPATSSTKLNATMNLDGSQVAIAYGSLNDSTAKEPFNMNVKLNKFPLNKAAAFIPGRVVRLGGFLDGDLGVTGSMSAPIINGSINGDSAVISLTSYGSKLTLANTPITITNNLVRFNKFDIIGMNNNPITIDGTVDINTMDINLRAKGDNVQFIGSEQRRFSEVFGKAFANIDATVKGNNNLIDARAKVDLLPGSNITYVMNDNISSLTMSDDAGMVTFINPATSMSTIDSLLMTRAGGSAINVQANLNIQRGAKLNAFLTSDGKDRVQLEGSGNLKYTLDFAGKSNFVGSYVIENGNVRYTPPVISQKLFDIASGSSVTWTGDIAKPELNITATNTMKASVSGNDRPVEFLVTAKLGKTLADMDLQFDLSCDNNMSVQNELQSMTSAQRSNAAMNLLLYNTYTGTNSTGNINLSSTSALYSFLQSQLNSWAASNLKGVDLTFGINQYDTGVNGQSSTETSYSYRLSKSLFNDRFKVVVGGEYSTDASQEENFSSNLINDISFEYHLNQSGTKYLRLFRHTGFESVIEGEITETGVGFVMKRKLSSLKNWFHSNKKSKTKLPSEDNIVAPVDSVATVPDEELSLPNDQQP